MNNPTNSLIFTSIDHSLRIQDPPTARRMGLHRQVQITLRRYMHPKTESPSLRLSKVPKGRNLQKVFWIAHGGATNSTQY